MRGITLTNYLSEQEIVDIFFDYLDNSIYNYAIMLDGSWGSGKVAGGLFGWLPFSESAGNSITDDMNPESDQSANCITDHIIPLKQSDSKYKL